MNSRIANKILNRNSFHWSWYSNDSGLLSLAPIHSKLYLRACRKLNRRPYYDKEWLELIEEFRKRNKIDKEDAETAKRLKSALFGPSEM